MLDAYILADEVSHLLSTTYSETKAKDKPFNLAFTEIANRHHVLGESRGALKSEIGGILSKRPRKPRVMKGVSPLTKTEESFRILKSDVNMVEFISNDKITFKYAKGENGNAVSLCNGGACHPSEDTKRAATTFANEFFALKVSLSAPKKPRKKKVSKKQKTTPIVKIESSDTHLLLVIDGIFEACFSPGKKGVIASVTKLRTPCRQKDVPSKLMKIARGNAITHFKGAGTLPLDFG